MRRSTTSWPTLLFCRGGLCPSVHYTLCPGGRSPPLQKIKRRRDATSTSSRIRRLDPLGHVEIPVVDLVDFLHALERLFRVTHALVDETKVIHDVFLGPVHTG
ncbi:MAG: hypothetical protein ACK56I_21300, partial [bacterium]